MSTYTWVDYFEIISNMSEKIMKTLSDTLNRLIGPAGIYSSNETAAKASKGISRSTFDRIRNGHKPGASAVGVDKLEGIAKTFDLEVWQLLVPNVDPNNKPTLLNESTNDLMESLSAEEKELLMTFKSLAEPERSYLLTQARNYSEYQKSKKSAQPKSKKSA